MVLMDEPVSTGQELVELILEPGEEAAVFIGVEAETGTSERLMKDYEEVISGRKVLWNVQG